jgi:multiple sugar transport system ATP-binding protein
MATVKFDAASRIYPGTNRAAVDRLDLDVKDAEFLVLVGPSGCGKSTSLRMLAGLEDVDEGSIYIGDVDVTELPPKKRDIAMVFQNYALYPQLTVAENMGFALRISKAPKSEIAAKVKEAARMLDLEQYLERYPRALSGGQRQRVAMGRAIVREPQVFLMDEPLSNLDAKLRVSTRAEIAALQRRLGITTFYVTHDQVEAMTMGDRVAVLKDGLLQQVAAPLELYDRPANRFVATFIGSPQMNMVRADVVGGDLIVGGLRIGLQRDQREAIGGREAVELGVRPEHIVVGGPDSDGLPAVVDIVEELGSEEYLFATASIGDQEQRVVTRSMTRSRGLRGEAIRISFRPDSLHLFDIDTGLRLVNASLTTPVSELPAASI